MIRAVVMAGGEGTRLRPMTANQPKPLLPVVNRPIMEHVLRLLKRHGFDETVVTVQYLAAHIRAYFGDGDELGLSLSYATESTPLGTAGSVRNAGDALRSDPFLVISGDALTDFDLSTLVAYHRSKGALVTIALKRVPDPQEFGIVITDDDGRIVRLLEKPTWGQVFSDTVNTGIYVMEPEALDAVAAGENVDWSADVFPRLLAAGAPLYGWIADGYWEDVGTTASYLRAQVDVLNRAVDVDIDGFELSPGVWIAGGAEVDPDARLTGPLHIGSYAKVESGATIRAYSVIGSNVIVKRGAALERAVVHDNAYIGPQVVLRGCVIGKRTDIMRAVQAAEGVIVGDDCVVEEEAVLGDGVAVYPSKVIEAGTVQHHSVIWESRGQRSLFGPRGVSGLVNVEITPELCVRLAAAYATTLRKGSLVTVAGDASRAARTFKRAVISALTASAIEVRDLEVSTLPMVRWDVRSSDAVGGIMLRSSPNDGQSIDLVFIDEQGADMSRGAGRKLERVHTRQEFRRAFPGEIAELHFSTRTLDTYVQDLTDRIDTRRLREAALKVVIDCAGGSQALVLPSLLGRLGVDALTVNGRLDQTATTESLASRMSDLERLGELVASSQAAFGLRYDAVGERIALVNEHGELIRDERALLVMLDLVAAESRGRNVALPVTTTRVAEQVCRFHGLNVIWCSTSPDDLTRAAAEPGVAFAADGRGGFVVPEFAPALDGTAAFVRVAGLIARTQLTLSEIDARIPAAAVVRRSVPTPWAARGAVMRAVLEHAADARTDTTDGVKVILPDGRWILAIPDPAEAMTHLWAEGLDTADSARLLQTWGALVTTAIDGATTDAKA
jgi:mannose-1-phosphate guanylyltransferase/phosphomannomutase